MSGIAPIKFVAIGGGTGLSTLLKGLKPYIAPPVPDGLSNAGALAEQPKRAERAETGPALEFR